MARRPRGSITAKGEGRWLVRLYVGTDGAGKRVYHSEIVEGGKKDAERVLTRLQGDRDRGALVVKAKETLDEYLDTWLETTAAPSVRARTLHDYTDTLARYVRPYLGNAKLADIAPADVRGMLVQLRARGLAPRTVRKALEVLRNALEQAVADRLLYENPARARLVKKALPQRQRKEPLTIRPEQVAAFLEAAREDRLHALWVALLMGGLRPSEALALQWGDVSGEIISVRRVLVDKPGVAMHFEKPKSATSRRAVVMPQVVVRALADHRKRQAAERLVAGAAWEAGELIFCDEIGRPLRQDHIRHYFAKLVKAAELPAGLTVYSLRHSCATLLLEKGVPLKVVSERLGHSTIALTADVYAHVTPSMQQQAADALGELAGS